MITVKKNNIKITRGDSAYINFNITDLSNAEWEFNEGDCVKVHVRNAPNDGDLLFEGTIEENCVWHILPENTNNLNVGTYWYDAQLETSNGDVFTFIPPSRFTVDNEVTYGV